MDDNIGSACNCFYEVKLVISLHLPISCEIKCDKNKGKQKPSS